MSIADQIINGTYGKSSATKKNNNETSSIANQIISGTYTSRLKRKKEDEIEKLPIAKQKASEIATSIKKSKAGSIDELMQDKELLKKYNSMSATEQAEFAKQAQKDSNTMANKLGLSESDLIPLKTKETIENESGSNLVDGKYLLDYSDKLFKPSAQFKDGYQFGDITKTAAGTIADAGMNVVEGITGIGEGIGDFLSGGMAQVAEWTGNKDYADYVRQNIAEKKGHVITNGLNKAESAIDKNSTIGDFGDEALSGVGQTLGYMALNAIPGAGQTLSSGAMFTSAAGNSMSDSYANGAENWQAWTRAIGSGAIETVTERLFGFFGKSGGIDKTIANNISSKLSSGFLKVLARAGINATSEAAEEAISYIGNQGMDYLLDAYRKATGSKGIDLKENWDWNTLGEQMGSAFLSSLITTGAMDSSQIANIKANNNISLNNAINEYAKTQDIQAQREVLDNELNKLNKQLKNTSDNTQATKLQEEIAWKQKQLESLTNNETQDELPTATKQQEIAPKTNEIEVAPKAQNIENSVESLPVVNEKYKVATLQDNLVETAKKYNLKYKDVSIQEVQKVLEKRKIKAKFDDTYFTDSSQGALYSITTNENGDTTRSIIFNPNANENTIIQEMAIHELTHDIIASNTETSKKMRTQVLDWLQKDDSFITQKENLKQSYLNIQDQNGNYVYNENQAGFNEMIEDEAIAKALQYKLGTQEQINRLVNENRSKAQIIFDWIKEKIANFKNRNNTEYKFWKDIQKKFETAYKETEFNPGNNKDKKFSIAGEKSKIADLEKLKKAKELEKQGKKQNEIYKETGWYKGNEGKWKFEIDDNNFNIKDVKILKDESYDLGEILDAPELFESYPELKNVLVSFDDINNRGEQYSRMGYDYITIKNDLISTSDKKSFDLLGLKNQSKVYSTLMHEIQHIIQNKEGFAKGASVEFWSDKISDINRKEKMLQRDFEYYSNEIGLKDYKEELFEKYRENKITGKELVDSIDKYIEEKGYTEKFKEIEKYQQGILKQKYYLEKYGAETLYRFTAGEIESRDVQRRIDKSSDWKKNNIPEVNENAFFVENDDYVDKSAEILYNKSNLDNSNVKPGELKNDFYNALSKRQWKKYHDKMNKIMNSTYGNLNRTDIIDGKIISTNITNHKEQVTNVFKTTKGFADKINEIIKEANKNGYNGQELQDYIEKLYGEENVIRYDISSSKYVRTSTMGENVESNNRTNRTVKRETTTNINEQFNRSNIENSNKSSFSIDNKGRTLTKEQQEYFKDSKVRDEKGNLITVYHGTPYTFNQFSYEKLGENTSSLGAGFYFTDKQSTAEEYRRDGGNIKEVYLDIKNPISYGKTTITKSEFSKFANAINEKTNGRLAEDYGDIQYAIDEYDYGGDDIDLVSSIRNASGLSWEELYKTLRDSIGKDGIISDEGFLNTGEKLYVAFNSNQIKNVDNINPTSDSDIRYSKEGFDDYIKNKIGKVEGTKTTLGELKNQAPTANNILSTGEYTQEKMKSAETKQEQEEIAKVLEQPVKKVNEKNRTWAILKANLIDKGIVFEELSQKTNNRELQGKWDYTLSSTARGQNAIGQARYEMNANNKTQKQISKSLEDIRSEVGKKTNDFQNYMYHQLNIDRMTLEERFGGDTGLNYENKEVIKNKPVFGKEISAEYSRRKVAEYEKNNPEFKSYAKDVYDFLDANMQELVDRGVVSEDLKNKLKEIYPHYVPIKRVDAKGLAIKVPLDTNRTGINSPLARATGGSSDIQPLFQTIADRTLQTYRASARNNFGVELMKTLQGEKISSQTDVESIINEISDPDTELLKEGKNGQAPTFTVFTNGEKVTFEITKDMYDALKPQSETINQLNNSKIAKGLNKVSNFRRGVLTEYNPIFSITNALKDVQDVVMNSQHPGKTYAKFGEAYHQILKNGYWYNEYIRNGGEQNSYFKDGEFTSDKKELKLKTALKLPLEAISNVNNVIEMAPRLAEYIASREAGRSIETSMLDASRVTTNFKAGGDFTKTLNRNGFTFLNASVQGFQQQIRNVKEANAKGLKGYAALATKYAIAGLPALILNGLVWKDDDDYEDLQDYVKDNYYIIAKYGDGKFIRIPKGRVAATIQKIVTNATEYLTDNDKKINIDNLAKDFWEDLKFAQDNVAPNNPLDNNVISPIIQAVTNTSWYGEDIVPSRLQNKPKKEQYDESIDSLSIWLGDKLNQSPYKINYLLDQYGGGLSDVVLPKFTKQAENNVFTDKFTTDSVMKSKYPGDFYSKLDELEIKSNSSEATDEDELKYKYASSVSQEMGKLYTQKREIQNSDISDKEKLSKLKEVQKQINDLAENALKDTKQGNFNGTTAKLGETQYYKSFDIGKGTETWNKLSTTEVEKNKDISLKTYADYKDKLAKETIKQREEGKISGTGSLSENSKTELLLNTNYSNKEKQAIYENYIVSSSDKKYEIIKESNININEYLKYKTQEFTSDKKDDGTVNGKSVSGSKKNKVWNYIANMNISYTQKVILYGLEYEVSNSDKTIIENYIGNMKGKTKQEKLDMISKFAGVTVYKDGTYKF